MSFIYTTFRADASAVHLQISWAVFGLEIALDGGRPIE
jgi:hypothetical protein